MRRFRLIRQEDVSGVSGTGAIVEGVEFSDGSIALRWMTAYRSSVVFDSIDHVIAVHGHDGATVVEWRDSEDTA